MPAENAKSRYFVLPSSALTPSAMPLVPVPVQNAGLETSNVSSHATTCAA